MVAPQQQFCVRWNSYHSNLQNAFPKLLTSEYFVDVTLACDNGLIKCHKVVLSACSNYFENILIQNPCQHPTIVLKDMKCNEVQALVDFMYKGEVNVTQEDLPSLLKAAEGLQIRGLYGTEQSLNQMNLLSQTASTPPCPPLAPVTPNLDQMATIPCTASATESAIPSSVIASCSIDKNITIKTETETKKRKAETSVTNIRAVNEIHHSDISKDDDGGDTSYDSQDDSEGDDKSKTESVQEDNNFNEEDLEMTGLNGDSDENNLPGTSDENGQQHEEYNASANVSCLYAKRIRRSEIELKQAADCIIRGQTFQNVSDQFNIPISTIRFFMARKGILPQRKRGRSSSANVMNGGFQTNSNITGDRSGNSSPIGPPFHIVHYKLPELSPKLN